ncbi:MAG: ABC transporter ATP-binding protein [Fibrobacter sp.]|nr:ABC transporter ATP-binding protein [Fibrobacter sp.]
MSKTYTRRGEEFNAVDDVEFFAWSGDFSVIYGESGSGKSTLLSLLSGISCPTQGSIIFNGADFANLTDAEISAIRNEKIGYVPQESVFLPHFTVLENILLPKALRDGKKIEVKSIADLTDVDIASKLEALGIAHLVQEMPAELSGGELKRAAIARALVNKPEIVIADEPTSNLDEINAKIVFELLAEFAQSGTSVLVATHDPRGFKYGDRVYTMHKGHLLPSGESDFGGL